MILHTPELGGNLPINLLVQFKHELIGTCCKIYDADLDPRGVSSGGRAPRWFAWSFIHHRDQPNRAVGRKVSFARAIGSIPPCPISNAIHAACLSKDMRRALWAAFWKAEGKSIPYKEPHV